MATLSIAVFVTSSLSRLWLPPLENHMTPLDYFLTIFLIIFVVGVLAGLTIWIVRTLVGQSTPSVKKDLETPAPENSNGQAKQDAQAFQTLVARLAGDNLREKERRRELEDEIRELSRQLADARREIEILREKLKAFMGT